MYKVKLMNKISSVGLDYFNEDYEYGETLENEDAILLRSASLHEYEFTKNVKAIARAGASDPWYVHIYEFQLNPEICSYALLPVLYKGQKIL